MRFTFTKVAVIYYQNHFSHFPHIQMTCVYLLKKYCISFFPQDAINIATNTCACICAAFRPSVTSVAEIERMVKELLIDRMTLSLYKRAKISAKDDRPSANSIGKAGVIFIVSLLVVVVLSDCVNVIDRHCRGRRRKRWSFNYA